MRIPPDHPNSKKPIDRPAPLCPYGMWRRAVAVALLCAAISTTSAIVSEGGYVPETWMSAMESRNQQQISPEEEINWQDVLRMAAEHERLQELEQYAEEPVDYGRADAQREDGPISEEIVRELEKYNQRMEREFPQPDDVEIDLQNEAQVDDRADAVVPELQKKEKTVKEEVPEKDEKMEQKPLVAQKKGQSEYVSFVEPVEAKQTKSIPVVDKRRLVTSAEMSPNAPKYNSSNLLMLGVGTVMAVGMIGTIVGGGMYLKRRRVTPDDSEYAPYAGTGPGFKKGKKGDKGDDALAYKAQLHHYQQAKQKIICGDDAPGMVESEGEDDGVDDENNFSVYECPGLAPTGDIEVVNPNFAAQP